jgi:hypothetical protein
LGEDQSADAVILKQGDSYAATSYIDAADAGGNFDTGDTFVFADGVDVVRNFDAEEDYLAGPANMSATASEVGGSDATGNIGDQEFGFVTGTFTGSDDNGGFTVNPTGSDTLVLYDVDSSAGTTDIECVVLVGVNNLSASDLV